MITKNQQKALDNLTSQFEKLNTPPKIQGGLIDVGAILSQHDADKKRKAEVEINNAEFKKLREDMIEKTIDTLNKDLTSLGLIAKKENVMIVKITSPSERVCHTKEINIYVEIKSDSERIGNGSIYVNNGIEFRLPNPCNKILFDTLEELVQYTNGKGEGVLNVKLKRLFNDVNILV